LLDRQNVNPDEVHAEKMAALAEKAVHTSTTGQTGTSDGTTASCFDALGRGRGRRARALRPTGMRVNRPIS
jgi:hypothetical protein